MPGRHLGRGPPTFEEDDLVVTGALVHGVHAVQVQRQAPPETVHLCRLQRHQVAVPGQPPEVLAWGTWGGAAGGRSGVGPALPSTGRWTPRGLPLKKKASPRIWATASKWALHLWGTSFLGLGAEREGRAGRQPHSELSHPGELGCTRPPGRASSEDPLIPHPACRLTDHSSLVKREKWVKTSLILALQVKMDHWMSERQGAQAGTFNAAREALRSQPGAFYRNAEHTCWVPSF